MFFSAKFRCLTKDYEKYLGVNYQPKQVESKEYIQQIQLMESINDHQQMGITKKSSCVGQSGRIAVMFVICAADPVSSYYEDLSHPQINQPYNIGP
ncbi:hypothetical protein Chor_008485 [Crotalus horridus]